MFIEKPLQPLSVGAFLLGVIMEEWRSINGYEGLYEVSNLGRIRSLDRYVSHSKNSDYKVLRRGKILADADNGSGYRYISLIKDGTKKNYYVHRLVADAFLERETGQTEIDHKDHNRANNRASNLQWITHRENIQRSAHLMRGIRKSWKVPASGEKYIRKRERRNKVSYSVEISILKTCKTFSSIEEAIKYRNEVLERSGLYGAKYPTV